MLPFENLSDEKEHAFFADGVQDDILTKLAKIADLKVISRTSVMQYRGKQDVAADRRRTACLPRVGRKRAQGRSQNSFECAVD